MFSKIGELIKPLLPQKEISDRKGRGQGGHHRQEEAADPAASEDVALFSTEAIRGMLKQSAGPDIPVEELDRLLAGLEALEREDIVSIPVRPGQSVFSAVADAVACLK